MIICMPRHVSLCIKSLFFEANWDEPNRPNSFEVAVKSDLMNDCTSSIPVTMPKTCSESLPRTDGIYGGTNTDLDFSPTTERTWDQPETKSANRCGTSKDLHDKPKPNCKVNYRCCKFNVSSKFPQYIKDIHVFCWKFPIFSLGAHADILRGSSKTHSFPIYCHYVKKRLNSY